MAGNIIPAIATASALVAGLVALEMCKVALNKPLEQFKSAQFNLANNLMLFWEPLPPQKHTTGEMNWTEWDTIRVDKGGDITMKELLQVAASGRCCFTSFCCCTGYWNSMVLMQELESHLEDADVEIDLVSCGKAVLFMSLLPKAKKTARLAMKVSEVAAEQMEDGLPDGNSLTLTIDGEDDDGEEVDLPKVLYTYR